MASNDNKKQKTDKKPSSSRQIKEQYIARLRDPGDASNKHCANLATKFWKANVCKEDYKKEDGSLDLDRYKQTLKAMLNEQGVKEEPIFVCGAEKLSKEPTWFVDNVPVCTDDSGNNYYQVQDFVIVKDLTQSRESGQKRKDKKKRPLDDASSASTATSNTAPLSSSSSCEMAAFSPTISGILARRNPEALNLHKRLRSEMKACKTAKDCVQVYDDPHFQVCLEAFRQTQDQFFEERPCVIGVDLTDEESANSGENSLVEAWARHWAQGVSRHQEWALILEDCRKTAFLLLKKVCELWNWKSLEDEKRSEDKQVMKEFQKRRIHQIVWYTLVMDRVNALSHMLLDQNALTKVRGLCWYSVYDDGDNGPRAIAGMPKNPLKPALNKRYIWLYQELYSEDDKAITKWVQIAFPPRLETPARMNNELFRQELKQAREGILNEEVKRVKQVQEEALQLLQQEMTDVVHAIHPAEPDPSKPPPLTLENDLPNFLEELDLGRGQRTRFNH